MVDISEIEYECAGQRLVGQLAVPDGSGKAPGILVAHEGPGIDANAKARALRLTEEQGYVTFALDYIGDGKRLDGMPAVMERLGPLMGDPLKTRALGQAGLDVLTGCDRTDGSKLAAIGHCFGGTMALELARGGAPLAAVVGFHSGLATTRPDDASAITGKVLVCIGAEDPLIPPQQRMDFEAEMRAGGVDWRMNLYGGAAHSFTNPDAGALGVPGIEYHELTNQRSWEAMLDLFREVGF
ncbi:MAG: dienelactone hydrolase family protein [Acidimicrobiia bacterium]|nr:dienelactone hydrolase family protein [Acidimicrobiia bacterium]MDH5289301.1 dienelactone hydrolase family protein [Acidimicrobiia bacterium]